MLPSIPAVAVALLGATTVLAQNSAPQCSLDKKCPKETPCCSQYGQCGVGAYCLGGCDPRMSFSLDSCVPEPVCESRTMKMDSTDRIVDASKYLGDPSKADWVAQGTPLSHAGNVLLTMPAHSAGTVLASTVYMWYGNVKARIKTSKDAGVVTAFILLSDVKDEIDFEWVGNELDIVQTNYYFQGIPNYTHSGNITDSTIKNTNTEWHTYEIRWTPEKIEWLVDDKVGRTWEKSKTWNATTNQWEFPQTPARVQLSIWPGGDEKNAKGTVDWAGGYIDWDSEAIKKDKYYYATVGEVTIDCYKTDKAPGTNSGKSYTYNNVKGTNDTVVDGDGNTVLKSLLGTGLDMDKDYPKDSSATSGTQDVIPGLSGGGPGTNGQAAGGASSGSGSGSGSGATPTGSSPNAACTDGFQQVCGVSGDENNGARLDRMAGPSAFAALIAVGAMLFL
ncbi:carbohydrate-binding module family 18 [Daldinia caldariorum]|uniref:carbohydrate-binding module family 18 n=1 Tax=Daldinia caldariorum TaxID=326644 RepID=UPI0020083FBF|nr:carbohydrate-binding module family 18 [Daldinia caldariorum]KAI1465176.1 carbohydrate-binding module family 18 [Daldinia caldariorum]